VLALVLFFIVSCITSSGSLQGELWMVFGLLVGGFVVAGAGAVLWGRLRTRARGRPGLAVSLALAAWAATGLMALVFLAAYTPAVRHWVYVSGPRSGERFTTDDNVGLLVAGGLYAAWGLVTGIQILVSGWQAPLALDGGKRPDARA
jgi:hypothetical protein